jgi:hypothetical protein
LAACKTSSGGDEEGGGQRRCPDEGAYRKRRSVQGNVLATGQQFEAEAYVWALQGSASSSLPFSAKRVFLPAVVAMALLAGCQKDRLDEEARKGPKIGVGPRQHVDSIRLGVEKQGFGVLRSHFLMAKGGF